MNKIKRFLKSNYFTVYMAFIFTAILILLNTKQNSEPLPAGNRSGYESVDTIIPFGHTLYPIEISNFSALDAMVGSYALVNIYNIESKKNSKLILQRIKIVRSPKDPRYFAALLKENEAAIISSHSGPFKVTIQNPKKPNDLLPETIVKKRRTITVENK